MKALLHSKGEYSPYMREAVIKKFLWEAWFSLVCGRKAIGKGDINYGMRSVFRAVCSWVEVLYAWNNRYLMNEKGSLPQIGGLDHKPGDMEARITLVYMLLAAGDAGKAYRILDELHGEVEELTSEIKPIITEIR